MKEYIEKEKVMEIMQNAKNYDTIESTIQKINSLPTTTTQYEPWKMYEFSDDCFEWPDRWRKATLRWFLTKEFGTDYYTEIREIPWDPDDLKQARLTLEKYWYEINLKK